MSISRVSAASFAHFPLEDRFGWLSNPLQQKVQNLLKHLDPIEQESVLEFTSNFLDKSSFIWSEEDSIAVLELFIEFSTPGREYFVETVHLKIQKNQTEWVPQDQLQLLREFLPLLSSEFEDLVQYTLNLTDSVYTSKQTLEVISILIKVLPHQRMRFVKAANLIYSDCLAVDRPTPQEMIFIYKKLASLSSTSEREAIRESAKPWLSTFIGFEECLIETLIALAQVEEENWKKVPYCYNLMTKTRYGEQSWSYVEKIEALDLIAKLSFQNWSYLLNLFEQISFWTRHSQGWQPFHRLELLKILSFEPSDELVAILNYIHRIYDAEKICPYEKIRAAKIFLTLNEPERKSFASLIEALLSSTQSPHQINTAAEIFLQVQEDERENIGYWTAELICYAAGFELSLIKAISLLSRKEREERVTAIQKNLPLAPLHIILALQTPFDPSRSFHTL